jgi:hypothetical protein
MTQTNLPQTASTQQQRCNTPTDTTLAEQQRNKRRRKKKSRGSKKGAQKEQKHPPSDVGRGSNDGIEQRTNTGDTEMNEVETSFQQKQGG